MPTVDRLLEGAKAERGGVLRHFGKLFELLRRLRERAWPHSTDFVEPCLPCPAKRPPAGAAGFMRSSTTDTASWPGATMTAGAVAYQEGYNFSTRFPQIVAA